MKKSLLLLLTMLCLYGVQAQNYTWTKKADLPDPNYQGASMTINNKVYVIGGVIDHINTPVNLNHKVWEYDPTANTWTQKNNAPGSAVFGASYFVIGNYGYIVNGWDSTNSGSGPPDCWRYDPASDTWAAMAPFPGSTRYTSSAFALNGKGYITCGFRPYVNDTWEYDPATNAWTTKASFPGVARQSMTSFVIGNYAYAGGGYPPSYNGWSYFASDYYKYDATNDVWTAISSFPGAPQVSEGTFTLDGKGYVVCAATENQYNYANGASTDIWTYDPSVDQWNMWGMFPDTGILGGNHVTCNGAGYIGQGEHFVFGTYSRVWWTFGPATGAYSCASTINQFWINNSTHNFQANGSFSPSAVLTWDFGDGHSGTGTSVIHSYAGLGTYAVTLTVTDTAGSGCTSTATTSVTVVNLSNCSVTASSQHLGSQYTLYAAASGAGPYTYTWTCAQDSSYSSTSPDPSVNLQPNVPTTYCVTIMDTTGCSASSCTTITYVPTVDSCATFLYIYPDGNIPGVYYAYVYHSGATPVSYSWSFGDGGTSIDSLPSYTYPTSGFFDICLTITDTLGCVSTYCDSLFYAFKAGGGPIRQLNAVSRNALGIKDITQSTVSVYPNPANSELNISTTDKLDKITIYTGEGQKVKEITSPSTHTVDINELANGIYFIEVQSNGNAGRAKFIKVNQ